jgi:tetratricopeptide (TPR) repeat protein
VPQISLPATSAALPDIEAYQHFLGAREVVQKRVSWRYPHAIEELSRAIEIDPAFADAYAERAVALVLNEFWTNDRGGDLDRAEQDVQSALALNPELARAHAAQAMVVARRTGARTDDERLLRRALELDPNMVDARLWLFRVLAAEGRDAEALEELERAVRLDPLAPTVVADLAAIEVQRGDVERAERRLLRLLEVAPPSDAAYQGLWRLYIRTGRLSEALDVGKRMILSTVAQGGRPARYYALIAGYSHLGLWGKAEEWQDRYNREYPDDYIIHLYPMWLDDVATGNLVMQGRFREALELTRNTLESFGSSVTAARLDVVVHYGILQALVGDHAAAIRSLDQHVDSDWRSELGIDAVQALAWAHLNAGSSSRAAELLDVVERQMAKSQADGYLHTGIYLYLYAQNAAMRGMTDGAIERLRLAVDAGWRGYFRALYDPRWDSVRDDPRFAAVIASVKADVDRQREDVSRLEAADDFVAQLEASIANEAARRGIRNR